MMEEPNAIIRWTIFVFATGDSAIWGAISITAIVMLSLFPKRAPPVRPISIIGIIALGLILIACGSPPVPFWFGVVTAVWLVAVFYKLRRRFINAVRKIDHSVTHNSINSEYLWFLSPLVWLLSAFAIEFPFQVWFASNQHVSTLLVIADSVTAGLNDGEDTWPKQLSRVRNVEVQDASQPGATLRSALRQNARLSGQPGTVVLEIGGNDMLEGLPVQQFERDLDQLLTEVENPNRIIVMFELPLPPLCAAYGHAQRRQAARHNVKLIPKRKFATVLTTNTSTVDGIHLSAKGQSRMMEMITNLFGTQMDLGTGKYQQFE